MENAARIGLNITEFWTLTPRELEIYIDAYIDHVKKDEESNMFYAYMGAYLVRAKKMPPLSNFLKTEEKPKEQTPEEILEDLKKFNASLGGKTY